MISTRDLSKLPPVDSLERLMRSLAMLDAILCPEWQYRYFSFDSSWAAGEHMGSMRNGQGDTYFALFNAAGCWLKGFDHEASMSPFATDPPTVAAGVLDGVPAEFIHCLSEPAFVLAETTFCIWCLNSSVEWQRGPVVFPAGSHDPDGSGRLLRWIDGRVETYREWAEGYYEKRVWFAAVGAVYAHQPLNQALVSELNSDLQLSDLAEDVREIGYPEL